jgi:hypothetical protein
MTHSENAVSRSGCLVWMDDELQLEILKELISKKKQLTNGEIFLN